MRMMRGRDQVCWCVCVFVFVGSTIKDVYQSNHFAATIDCVRPANPPLVHICDFSKRVNSHVSTVTPNIIRSVSLVQLRYVKVSSHENYMKKWCCVKRLKVAQNFGFERGATVTSLSFCFVSTSAVIGLVLSVRA